MKIIKNKQADSISAYQTIVTLFSIILVFTFGSSEVLANDSIIITKVAVEDRILIEKHTIHEDKSLSDDFEYTIEDLNDSISHIKNTTERMYPYHSYHYPRYNDYFKYKEEIDKLQSITIYHFLSKGKESFLTKRYALSWIMILLRNNGDVIVTGLQTLVPLLTFCTPEEVVELFDKIGAYKFTAPIAPVSDYKDGYLLTGKGISYPEDLEECQ